MVTAKHFTYVDQNDPKSIVYDHEACFFFVWDGETLKLENTPWQVKVTNVYDLHVKIKKYFNGLNYKINTFIECV